MSPFPIPREAYEKSQKITKRLKMHEDINEMNEVCQKFMLELTDERCNDEYAQQQDSTATRQQSKKTAYQEDSRARRKQSKKKAEQEDTRARRHQSKKKA